MHIKPLQINKKTIQQLNQLENSFSQNRYKGELTQKNIFFYKNNHSYVCFSAPHATESTVHKTCKISDCFTGSITKYICEKYTFSYIIRKRYSVFKKMISTFVEKNNLDHHYFIDIHAMHDRPFDLAIGLGYLSPKHYKQELLFLKKLCQKYKLSYVINHPSYTGKIGFTGRFQKKYKKSSIIQLEWTKNFRDFNQYPNNILNKTIPFLVELANFLNTLKKEEKIQFHILPKPIQKIKDYFVWICHPYPINKKNQK